MREYTKKRRESLKERGICPNCEKRPSAPSRTCCVECLDYKRLAIKRTTTRDGKEWLVQQIALQDGLCALCDLPMKNTYIDHDHNTGKLRALLCSNCNTGLGKLRDDPQLMRKAADYVERHAL